MEEADHFYGPEQAFLWTRTSISMIDHNKHFYGPDQAFLWSKPIISMDHANHLFGSS